MPSTEALDVVAVTDIEADLASAIEHLERTISKLRPAIDAVAALHEPPHRTYATPTAACDAAGDGQSDQNGPGGVLMATLDPASAASGV